MCSFTYLMTEKEEGICWCSIKNVGIYCKGNCIKECKPAKLKSCSPQAICDDLLESGDCDCICVEKILITPETVDELKKLYNNIQM